jgi:oligoendopeptidase F
MAELKLRKDVDPRYSWRLDHMVNGDAAWEELFNSAMERESICLQYKGKLSDRKILIKCLVDDTSLSDDLARLYVYAKMKSDEDTSNSLYKGMTDRAEMLIVKVGSNNSYIVPEITAFSTEELVALSTAPEFKDYDVFFKDLIRSKKHILSEKEEKILAESQLFSSDFRSIFNVLDNADLKFDNIRDEEGKTSELNHGSYSVFMQSPDRNVRKNAFKTYYKSYKQFINTIASNYAGNVKKDCFYAKVRGFSSALEKSMHGENVDKEVYVKLLDAVGNNVRYVHEYVKLRKKVLGYKKIHMYDLYVPIIEGADLKMDYPEAYELVVKALSPLGSEYIEKMKEAYTGGWIDVYENQNKRSGAYSWGVYGTHPYVLLNYRKTTHDVFTIAHEMGHAMHTYNSSEFQPVTKADYEIFVAEVASTVNELLLLKYMMKNTEDPELKKYLLTYLLDTFRTTLFRQTMFSEFEKKAHDLAEQGMPLTPDALNEVYYDLNVKYYGKEVSDDDIKYEWSRIPHFYTSFYVYKYATGLTSACMISDKLLNDPSYKEKYFKFLRAGRSMSPVDILRLADVDLMTDAPYEAAMKLFRETLEELKKVI